MRSWGVLGGLAAALAAGVYVLWGPIAQRKRRRRGGDALGSVFRLPHPLLLLGRRFWPFSLRLGT